MKHQIFINSLLDLPTNIHARHQNQRLAGFDSSVEFLKKGDAECKCLAGGRLRSTKNVITFDVIVSPQFFTQLFVIITTLRSLGSWLHGASLQSRWALEAGPVDTCRPH